jgi:2-polyprenyl-6-methoxyphenol hydroxylase-like FAD-dependent oxidoreductase
MAHSKAIIIGGGISGLSTALALVKITKIPVENISVHELRPSPSTIGGAVNLTPSALRYLAALDVLSSLLKKGCETRIIEILSHRTGTKLGEVNFDNLDKFGYRAMRVKRGDLLEALLGAWEDVGGVIKFESKIVGLDVEENGVKARFEDGSLKEADFLVGCDGIHSWVRTEHVEPERTPVYSGIAGAYGFGTVTASDRDNLPLESTAAIATRRGTLLLSYCNPEKTELYVAAVMETKEEGSREGWRVKGEDKSNMKRGIMERFAGDDGMGPTLHPFIDKIEDWFLFPVHNLTPRGKWSKGPVLLLGDAAHAVSISLSYSLIPITDDSKMPPQGESIGFAIEDSILLSRILIEKTPSTTFEEAFQRYTRNRKPRIDEAFDEASFRWETAKDAGWFATIVKEWLTSAFLWWTKASRDENFAFDVRKAALVD